MKVSITSLKEEFDIKTIDQEQGTIGEPVIVNGDREFSFIEENGGYSLKTIYSLVKRNADKVRGKSIVLRHENGINRWVLYDYWGLYIETGRKLVPSVKGDKNGKPNTS